MTNKQAYIREIRSAYGGMVTTPGVWEALERIPAKLLEPISGAISDAYVAGKLSSRKVDMESGKPIKPSDVVAAKARQIHPLVIDTFNALIVANWSHGRSVISQAAVMAELVNKHNINRQEVLSNNGLDIEDVYRAAGWRVEYDKPGYNESYEATFTFTAEERHNEV